MLYFFWPTSPQSPPTPPSISPKDMSIQYSWQLNKTDRWRYTVTMDLFNNSSIDANIPWIRFEAINVTYTDGSHDLLNIQRNETENLVVASKKNLALTLTVTEYGFDKEPESAWIRIEIYVSELKGSLVGYVKL